MSYVGKVTAGGSTHLVGSTLYGTCATAAGTAAKVVTCANFDQLIEGVTIHVKFTYSNTAANPTLNVNSTGAKNIYRYGTTAPSTSVATSWNDGSVVSFTYDGTYWQMNNWLNTDTDNNTTYTFANGTNGFTVTPSGGTAQTVTVTPSITNNVTGSGTSGYIAKFNGAHTVTNGPQLGSSTTTFLRNDGSWATPTDNNTTYTFANGTNGFTVTPSGGTAQTVTVTPSITNNVTGTGTSGKLAAFTGAHTIGDGPEFVSTGERFLKEDGTWADVEGITGYEVIRDNNIHTWAESLGTGFWPFVTSTTTTGLPDDSSSLYTMAHGFALTRLSPESGTHTRHIVLYSRDGETWLDYQTTSGGTGPWAGWTRMATTWITDDLDAKFDDYVAKTSIVNNFTQTAAGTVLDGRIGKNVYDNSLYSKGSVANFSTNLNAITDPGVYHIPGSAGATNLPTGITYGTLTVIKGAGSSSFFNQVLYAPADSAVMVYTRSTVDGGATWREWARYADDSKVLHNDHVTQSQTVTDSGYALDARQANPNVSGSLGAKVSTNTSNISTLTTNLGTVTTNLGTVTTNLNTLSSNLSGLKFEHQVKTGVTTSYNSANVLSFDGKVLNATNYNGHAFLIVLSGPPSNSNSYSGCSLIVVTFSTSNTPAYNIMYLFRHGYSASGGNEYPKFGATAAGNLYVVWNATPTSGGSLNIHASMFQLY